MPVRQNRRKAAVASLVLVALAAGMLAYTQFERESLAPAVAAVPALQRAQCGPKDAMHRPECPPTANARANIERARNFLATVLLHARGAALEPAPKKRAIVAGAP